MAKDNPINAHQIKMGVWASEAKPGDEYVCLKRTNTAAAGQGRKPEAQAAWNLYLGGVVLLVQRKLRNGKYDYVAVRTRASA